MDTERNRQIVLAGDAKAKRRENILESGRWMERELNRFCERQINKEERRDMKKKASRVFILRPV